MTHRLLKTGHNPATEIWEKNCGKIKKNRLFEAHLPLLPSNRQAKPDLSSTENQLPNFRTAG